MKKIISAFLVAVFALSFMLIPASAEEFNTIDSAGLLTADEIQALEQLAVDIEADYGYCAMICFTDNINGYDSVRDYGEMLYNNYADCENAVIFVHDLNRNLCDFFIAEDYEEYVFDSDVTDPIFDAYNNAETYYLGANIFYNLVYGALSDAGVTAPEEITDSEDDTDSSAEETTAAAEIEETTEFEQVDRTLPLVVDYADLLSSDEEQYFLAKCEEFTASYATEIAIITITDLEGKTPQEYADDFYDSNGYGYGENDDGILMIYLPGESGQRELHITTHGSAKIEMTGEEVDNILDTLVIYLGGENYYDAFESFIDMSEDAIKPPPALLWPIICVLVGIAIGILITSKMASANYSVAKKETAADYVRAGTLVVNNANDIFAGSRVITTPRPKSNSDSSSEGGSTSHTSSSGRSHGGGGRSF